MEVVGSTGNNHTPKYAASYFGVASIRQGMRWIQVLMILLAFLDMYPAVLEAGYECEMAYSDFSTSIGAFSQLLCWIDQSIYPWAVCKYSAMVTFCGDYVNQLSLIFGLILISSPKPSVGYVKVVRYLAVLSFLESFTRLIYHLAVHFDGADFVKNSSSCVFGQYHENAPDFLTDSTKDMGLAVLGLLCYGAFIWGTYALVDVLKKGGTGDEGVAEDDVLSLVKTPPPKLLVLSSAFGLMDLRPAVLVLSCMCVGFSSFHVYSNIFRMVNWCGSLAMEKAWCTWPYGSLAAGDQVFCTLIALGTIHSVISMRSSVELKLVKFLWFYVVFSSIAFLLWSYYIAAEYFPAYWMNNIRTDIWVYYARFWLSLLIAVFVYSIGVIRLAGGVGWENQRDAQELINTRLSEEVVGVSRQTSLNDLLGGDGIFEQSPPENRYIVQKTKTLENTPPPPETTEEEVSSQTSRETSPMRTPERER